MATSKGKKTSRVKASDPLQPRTVNDDEIKEASPADRRAARAAAPMLGSRRRTDTADAFMPDPEDGPARIKDDLAEVLAEDFLRSATSGDNVDDEVMEQVVAEEFGGPFVESSADEEFAEGTDESNPIDAVPEPLPRAVHGLSTRSRP
jgi:hypothetical protein